MFITMEELEVCVCPNCGETWHVYDNSLLAGTCRCFRCNCTYIPTKVYKMFDFVYRAIKTVKGER